MLTEDKEDGIPQDAKDWKAPAEPNDEDQRSKFNLAGFNKTGEHKIVETSMSIRAEQFTADIERLEAEEQAFEQMVAGMDDEQLKAAVEKTSQDSRAVALERAAVEKRFMNLSAKNAMLEHEVHKRSKK